MSGITKVMGALSKDAKRATEAIVTTTYCFGSSAFTRWASALLRGDQSSAGCQPSPISLRVSVFKSRGEGTDKLNNRETGQLLLMSLTAEG